MNKSQKFHVLFYAVLILFAGIFSFAGNADAARLGITNDLPKVIDGNKQREIEIIGILEGRGFKNLRLHAEWKNYNRTDTSPELKIENTNFKHAFPLGGAQNCGIVTFYATGKNSGVDFNSEKKTTYIDCLAPRILIGKPTDGQFVKAGSLLPIEIRIEDDLINEPSLYGLLGYTLNIDLNGQTVSSPQFSYGSPVLQKYNISLPNNPGRHGIRVKITDLTMKSDEKTIWVNADGTPPNVKITSPTANQTVSIPSGGMPVITVEVEASDAGDIASGIDKVEFYLNNAGVASVQNPSGANKYAGTFGVPEQGQKNIKVKAFDKVGNVSEANINVNIVFEGSTLPAGQIPKMPRSLPR